MATYYEYESEGKVLSADLTSKKSNQIKVPANLNSLILDRKPQKRNKRDLRQSDCYNKCVLQLY